MDDGSCAFGENEVTDMTATTWDLNVDALCEDNSTTSVLTFDGDSPHPDRRNHVRWSLCGDVLTLVMERLLLHTGTWNGSGLKVETPKTEDASPCTPWLGVHG